jgi:signal transduction histidine kinase
VILRWLNTLTARIALYLVIALLVTQVAILTFLLGGHDEGRSRELTGVFFREAARLETLANRIHGPDLQANLRSASRAETGYWISDEPILSSNNHDINPTWWMPRAAWRDMVSSDKRLKWYADMRPLWMRLRIQNLFHAPPGQGQGQPAGAPPGPGGAMGDVPPPPPRDSRNQYDFGEATTLEPTAPPRAMPVMWRVSIQLADGTWLNGEHRQQDGMAPWANVLIQQSALSLVLMLVATTLAVGFATKRLRLLANAADRVGRGESLEPIRESGTSEVRQLTQSFNTMSLRLRRFIEARTQMLGAISHDLRTPITGLRLRAELVDDDENRERMLAIIDELHHLTEATLALARDDSFTEVTDRVDVSSLIEAICDDLTDVGIDVTCNVARGVNLNCRPFSLRRAIRNLAENGAKYGQRSRIQLNGDSQAVKIIIDDDGPGIPEDQLERVLLPFVRLESSRSRETGGAGLGLAITRSIVLNHGGELDLKNRPEGGLRATITLPVAA